MFDDYSGLFNKDLVKVFIVDSGIKNHSAIASLVNKCQFGYFLFVGEPRTEDAELYDADKCFGDGHELILRIAADLPAINKILKSKYGYAIKPFNFTFNPNSIQQNPYYPTLYSHTNYFTDQSDIG